MPADGRTGDLVSCREHVGAVTRVGRSPKNPGFWQRLRRCIHSIAWRSIFRFTEKRNGKQEELPVVSAHVFIANSNYRCKPVESGDCHSWHDANSSEASHLHAKNALVSTEREQDDSSFQAERACYEQSSVVLPQGTLTYPIAEVTHPHSSNIGKSKVMVNLECQHNLRTFCCKLGTLHVRTGHNNWSGQRTVDTGA